MLRILFSLVLSYLIGSIPTAYLFGRFYKGIDIRQFGSGNVGATNAFRVLGKIPGTIVLLIDIFKGVLATTVVASVGGIDHLFYYTLLGVVVVVGHNWTVFLNFRGGKGIATSLGVLIGLTIKISILRPILGLAILIWLVIFLITGFVSLSSIITACFLPILMLCFKQPFEMILLGVLFCVFVVIRHRPNIARLREGKESKTLLFSKKKI